MANMRTDFALGLFLLFEKMIRSAMSSAPRKPCAATAERSDKK